MKRFKSGQKAAAFAVLALFAALFLFCACASDNGAAETEKATVTVYGKEFSADAKELVFSGDEVDGVDALIAAIPEFTDLRSVDFGSYSIEASEAERVREAFAGIDLTFPTHVTMYGRRFDPSEITVDLDGAGMTSTAELEAALPFFPLVEKIVCRDSAVTFEDMERLMTVHPDIRFELVAVGDICGVPVRGDEAELDLTGCVPNESLADKLRLLYAVETVDLRGTETPAELQKELKDRYPDVRFLWEVDILGVKYDSQIEDLDLSDSDGLTLDQVRETIPLFCDLKRIDLSDCGFENEDLGRLREEFPDVKIVWRLYMGKWSLKTDAVAFSVLIYNYNYTALTEEDIEVLKYCTDLQALDLGHQRIKDLTVIGEYLTELRILILADNWVRDLTPLTKLKHLHYIELFVNPYLEDVSPLGECKELVDINISHLYKIKDISNLFDFPIVERFWIENTGVSSADVRRLVEAYPDANVNYEGWGSVDRGWRTHPRYYAMIDMFHKTDYISEEFSKYDSAD